MSFSLHFQGLVLANQIAIKTGIPKFNRISDPEIDKAMGRALTLSVQWNLQNKMNLKNFNVMNVTGTEKMNDFFMFKETTFSNKIYYF